MLFLPRENGQGMTEYGMAIVLVAVVIVAILTVFGPQVGNMFSRVTTGFAQQVILHKASSFHIYLFAVLSTDDSLFFESASLTRRFRFCAIIDAEQ